MNGMIKHENGIAVNQVVARQTQEVQGAIFMAKQFPRDERIAEQRILRACENKRLAEASTYCFPRSGQDICGPSIRLAEAISQAWGNIDYGIIELKSDGNLSEMMAYAWDLETNVRRSMIFSVKHERDKKNGGKQQLTSNRDIYEITANMGARRVRACILGIIPSYIVDAAMEKCKETARAELENKDSNDLYAIAKQYVDWFSSRGVPLESLEKYVGETLDSWGTDEISKIRDAGHSIADGMTRKEELFPELSEKKPISTETSSEAANLNEQLGLGG